MSIYYHGNCKLLWFYDITSHQTNNLDMAIIQVLFFLHRYMLNDLFQSSPPRQSNKII